MAVKLKLTRLGSKKHPFYRVVAATDETRRDGRPLAFLGYYNPMTNPVDVKLEADQIKECPGRGTHGHRARPHQKIHGLIAPALSAERPETPRVSKVCAAESFAFRLH